MGWSQPLEVCGFVNIEQLCILGFLGYETAGLRLQCLPRDTNILLTEVPTDTLSPNPMRYLAIPNTEPAASPLLYRTPEAKKHVGP